jgi:hypothetical protein
VGLEAVVVPTQAVEQVEDGDVALGPVASVVNL